MTKNNLFKYNFYIFLVLCFVFLDPLKALAVDGSSPINENSQSIIVRAKVIDTSETLLEPSKPDYQTIHIQIMEGNYRNKSIIVDFHSTGQFSGIVLREKDEVFVTVSVDSAGVMQEAYITEIARDKYMIYLLLGFIGILILVGGSKGLRAVFSIILTYIIVLKIMLPLILAGYSPIYVAIGLCSLITIITLLLVGGFNRKTYSAIIGTICGLCVAAYLAITIGNLTHLTGAGDDDFYLLGYLAHGTVGSYQGLLFAGIIIGSLGAVMDVGMSIASAVNELQTKSYHLRTIKLIKAGMNVGRDIMGTMSNTLILAYAGGSINLLLLLVAEDISLFQLINSEIIAAEILRSMAGSIGLIMTVPITAIVAGFLIKET